MPTRYLEDRPGERESRLVSGLRFVIMIGVWILVGLAAFSVWLVTAA